MAVKIGHAFCTEKNDAGYNGSKAGDQTGKELRYGEWYKRTDGTKWNCVLRFADKGIVDKAVELIRFFIDSNKVGYSQPNRNSLHNELKNVGYANFKKIGVCEADCSSLVTACYIAAGVTKLEYTGTNCPATINMRARYKAAGFDVLTDAKYLDSDKHLVAGDLVVCEGHHVFMVLENGANVAVAGQAKAVTVTPQSYATFTSTLPEIKKGSKGMAVKILQTILGIEADGVFGAQTDSNVKALQKRLKLTADGIVGAKTWAELFKTVK